MRAAGVVAADARVRRAAEIECRTELVGVAAGGGIDYGVRSVDEVELVVAQSATLGGAGLPGKSRWCS